MKNRFLDLILLVSSIALMVGAIVIIGVVAVDGFEWTTSSKYFELIGPGAITGIGAILTAILLFIRWRRDHNLRIEQEDRRVHMAELHQRSQERGKRRETIGARMTTAIEHIDSNNRFRKTAGLIEMSSLIDDWFAIESEEMLDLEQRDTTQTTLARKESIPKETRRRQQEIIDLVFKQDLRSNEDSTEEFVDISALQRTRAEILRSHIQDSREDWSDLNFESSLFWSSDLHKLDLSGFNFPRTNFKNSNLHEVQFVNSTLTESNFTDSNLSEVKLTNAKLAKVLMTNAILVKSDLTSANIQNATLTGARLSSATSSLPVDLSKSSLIDAKLIGAHLEGANLASADLSGADLRKANLTNANLKGAILVGADLRGTRLNGANLFNARFVEPEDFIGPRRISGRVSDKYKGQPRYNTKTRFPAHYKYPEKHGFVFGKKEAPKIETGSKPPTDQSNINIIQRAMNILFRQ